MSVPRPPLVGIEPLTVSPREAERLLTIGKSTLFLLLKHGRLESVKIGNARRITMQSIKRLAAEGTPPL